MGKSETTDHNGISKMRNFNINNFEMLDNEEKLKISQNAEEQRIMLEEKRRSLLRTILEPAAIERLNRIALVKPEKAAQIEDYIIRTVRINRFSEHNKMKEEELVNILSRSNELVESSSSKIKIYRKGIFDEDDDLNY